MLKVLGRDGSYLDSHGRVVSVRWLCKCKCGRLCHARTCNLVSGGTTSCGCKNRQYELTLNGETHSIGEWSKLTGIPRDTIYKRVRKGLPPEKVLKDVRKVIW